MHAPFRHPQVHVGQRGRELLHAAHGAFQSDTGRGKELGPRGYGSPKGRLLRWGPLACADGAGAPIRPVGPAPATAAGINGGPGGQRIPRVGAWSPFALPESRDSARDAPVPARAPMTAAIASLRMSVAVQPHVSTPAYGSSRACVRVTAAGPGRSSLARYRALIEARGWISCIAGKGGGRDGPHYCCAASVRARLSAFPAARRLVGGEAWACRRTAGDIGGVDVLKMVHRLPAWATSSCCPLSLTTEAPGSGTGQKAADGFRVASRICTRYYPTLWARCSHHWHLSRARIG